MLRWYRSSQDTNIEEAVVGLLGYETIRLQDESAVGYERVGALSKDWSAMMAGMAGTRRRRVEEVGPRSRPVLVLSRMSGKLDRRPNQ